MAFVLPSTRLCCVAVFVPMWAVSASTAYGQYVATSLAQLRTYSQLSNATVTLAAGEYWINGDHIANPKSSEPTFLELSGSNVIYDLSQAQIKLDTRKLAGFGRALAHDSGIEVVKISGTGNTVRGLNLTGYDVALDTDPNARRYADWAATYVQMTGTNNRVQGANVLTRGSSPYGYGDVFGKGARVDPQGAPASEGGLPWIAHNKTSAFQVIDAVNPVIDDMHLDVRTYGHGFFVQGTSTNTTLKNSTVTGQLFSSNDTIASPKYQEYGMTSHGNPLPANMMISGNEDGVRMYTGPSGLTVENVVVTNMRTGFSTALGKGTMTLKNVEAYGTENAFNFTSNTTITGAKGDITHGPLVYIPYGNVANSSIDVELVGGIPQGVNWSAAYLNGDKLNVTIRSDLPAGALPADSLVRFGQKFFENWRDTDHPTGPDDGADDFINSTFNNATNQMLVLGNDVTGNTGTSKGMVVTNGKNNAYNGVSVVLNGTRTVLTHVNGLGNNGSAAAGTLDSNGSIVRNGGTLEVQSGITITNEKLVITGDGVDGKGALYTAGATSSSTRFGSSSGTDESTIFLDGNASIGVGTAGNQFLVGRIQGTGDLTKRGAGILSMEKSSTLNGSLIIAEGGVVARSGVVNNSVMVAAGAYLSSNGNTLSSTNGTAQIDGKLDLNGRTSSGSQSHTIGYLTGSGRTTSSNPTAGSGGTLTLSGAVGSATYAGSIDGLVSVVKSGNAAQSFDGAMTHTGTTTVAAGTLAINGTHTGGGDYTVSGGTLAGVGSIGSHVIVQAATLAPGRAGSGNVGTLAIGRDLRLASASTVQLDFNTPAAADRVNVGGIATIAGKLSLGTVQPSAFRIGDTVTLVNATTGLTGTFNQVSGVAIGPVGGRQAGLAVTYGPKSVSARVSVLGDATLDDAVGNADIGVVFGNYAAAGAGATWSRGDFDGDGRVDNRDIGTVFGNYGGGAPATLAAAGVQLAAADRADLVYDRGTGRVTLVGAEAAGGVITNFVLGSDGAFLNTSSLTNPYAGVFFVANASEVSASDPLTAGRPTIDLANLLPAGLSPAQLASIFTTATYVGALGTGVQNLDLVVVVPEPGSVIGITFLALAMRRRRSSSRSTRATV